MLARTTAVVASISVLSLLGAGCALVSSDDADVVAMYPIDDSRAANAATTISFRGATPDDLDDLVVTGSRSGRHEGELVEHGDGDGATFRPDEPFEPGEEVTVATDVDIAAAADDDKVGFRIAVPAETSGEASAGAQSDLPDPVLLDLITLPEAAVPRPTVEGDVGDAMFLATPQPVGDSEMGAQIIDSDGNLVWWRAPSEEGLTMGNLSVHELDGEPVLAWFEGTALFGQGGSYEGEWIVVDSSYEEVTRISGANGIPPDIHDVMITDRDTIVVVAYQPVVMSLADDGGPDEAVVLDSVVQEIDVRTGDVYFEWHSLDAVPITDSRNLELTDERLDYAHINSVDLGPDRNVLISLRRTSQVMEVDRVTGRPVWILGGDSNTVDVGDDIGISYPHHARWLDDGTVSIFDNGVERDDPTSRGVVYELSDDRTSAELVDSYAADPPEYTATQGSIQVTDDGALAMWSNVGLATYFDGEAQPTGTIDLGVGSYRMFVADWVGAPSEPPAVIAGGDRVVVSWNGATDVDRWEASIDGELVAAAPADGFESAIEIPADAASAGATVVVRAVDDDGNPIEGSTASIQLS